MIDVEKQEEVEPTKKANPKETVRWTRPDGWMEYHWPHGKPMELLPPRSGPGGLGGPPPPRELSS